MEENQVQTPAADKPQLFSGTFLSIVFFLTYFSVFGINWLSALLFAALSVSVIRHLCQNEPGKGLACAASTLLLILWSSMIRLLSDRILQTCFSGPGKAVSAVHDLLLHQIPGTGFNILETFCLITGAGVIHWGCLQIFTLLPENFKFSRNVQFGVVFAARFVNLLFCTLFFSIVLNKGLNMLRLPGIFAFCILPVPLLFWFKIWQKTQKDVDEFISATEPQNQESGKIKALTIPDLTLQDVAGMDDVKEQIMLRMIEPLKNPDMAKKHGITPGGGILLYGPPGTGKTYIAKAVAGELKIPFYAISVSDIFSKYVGESEQNIREIFKELRKHELAVLFIDELETIFHRRTDEIHETTRKIISIILQELDGIESRNTGLLLIGATNTPQLIDEAFLRAGRFDVQIFVGLPDAKARLQIIKSCFADVQYPIEPGLPELLAECTGNFTGADLKGFAQKVKQRAFARNIRMYDRALFQECLSGIYPNSHKELLHQIRKWEAQRNNQKEGNE